MNTTEALVRQLELLPHPEGGYYKETYRSQELITGSKDGLFPDQRSYGTAIYFLLGGNDFSAFHRIKSDEIWHFYEGGPLHIYVINESGELSVIKLGRDISAGAVYQAVVPAGCWFASAPAHKEQYALVGCTVAPGFDFRDFEMAERQELCSLFPQHITLITQLTRI